MWILTKIDRQRIRWQTITRQFCQWAKSDVAYPWSQILLVNFDKKQSLVNFGGKTYIIYYHIDEGWILLTHEPAMKKKRGGGIFLASCWKSIKEEELGQHHTDVSLLFEKINSYVCLSLTFYSSTAVLMTMTSPTPQYCLAPWIHASLGEQDVVREASWSGTHQQAQMHSPARARAHTHTHTHTHTHNQTQQKKAVLVKKKTHEQKHIQQPMLIAEIETAALLRSAACTTVRSSRVTARARAGGQFNRIHWNKPLSLVWLGSR